MITTIGEFVKELPEEVENRCDPTFLQNLIRNLATLSLVTEGKAEITGISGGLLTSRLPTTVSSGVALSDALSS